MKRLAANLVAAIWTSGAAFAGGSSPFVVTNSPCVRAPGGYCLTLSNQNQSGTLSRLVVKAPGPGFIVVTVNASGVVDNSNEDSDAQFTLQTQLVLGDDQPSYGRGYHEYTASLPDIGEVPLNLNAQAVFGVLKAGKYAYSFRLHCRTFPVKNTLAFCRANGGEMTAVFYPSP